MPEDHAAAKELTGSVVVVVVVVVDWLVVSLNDKTHMFVLMCGPQGVVLWLTSSSVRAHSTRSTQCRGVTKTLKSCVSDLACAHRP